MKRLLLTITAFACVFAQDPISPVGNWKLSGLAVDYMHIARETTDFELCVHYPPYINCDGSDNDISLAVQTIPAGVFFKRITNGPLGASSLGGIGVNLNVNVYEGNVGSIAEGSFYPDIELSESQDCVTDLQIFSVNENFTWSMGDRHDFTTTNVLGMEDGLLCDEFYQNPDNLGDDAYADDDNDTCDLIGAGDGEAYGFGLNTGLFDQTTSTPTPERIPPGIPYIATLDAEVLAYSCGAWCAGGAAASPDLPFGGDVTACTTTCAGWSYAEAGAYSGDVYPGWLKGTGTSSKFMLNTGNSSMDQDLGIDFKLIWDAIDGETSGLGFGDDPDVDEDGDDSPFDRILGVPSIPVTFVKDTPECDITGGDGLNSALAGDVVDTLGEDAIAALLTDGCIAGVAGLCNGAGSPSNLAYGGCMTAATDGVLGQCEEAGQPSVFATGLCVGNAGGDLLQGVCSSDGYIAAIVGLCVSLDNDDATCSALAASAQGIFDYYYSSTADTATEAAAAAAAAATAADAAQADADADPDNTDLADAAVAAADAATAAATAAAEANYAANMSECDLLANTEFATGACGTVVGGLIDEEDCSVWVDSLSDGFFNTAAEVLTGTSCTDLGAANANYDCSMTAWLDGFAANSSSTANQTCTDWGNNYIDDCLTDDDGKLDVGDGTKMYLMNPDVVPSVWGYFATFKALSTINALFPAGIPEDTELIVPAVNAFCGTAANADAATAAAVDAATAAHVAQVAADAAQADADADPDNTDLADAAVAAADAATAAADAATAAAAAAGLAQQAVALCVNDSDHDFDPTCLADGIGVDINQDDEISGSSEEGVNCSGRFELTFFPTCVPELEARQVVAEFVNLDDLCAHDGDVNFNCVNYDWNYNVDADTLLGSGNGDGFVSEAECQAYADSEDDLTFFNNPGPILNSCDEDEGETPETDYCSDYGATVVWNSYEAYTAAGGMCGDGDPNDLVPIGATAWCAGAVPTGLFDTACTAPVELGGFGTPTPDWEIQVPGAPDGYTMPCNQLVCNGYYAAEEPPSFEQSCSVGDNVRDINDIIKIINHIIANSADGSDQLGGEAGCRADLTQDGDINVLDVIALVTIIINDAGSNGRRIGDASKANISITDDNKLVIDADGYIGGVDMIIEFTDNFDFELANSFASNYKISGNTAHIIMVDHENITEVLTMKSGKIVSIVEALVANSSNFVTTSIEEPSIFTVNQAYPNPFNPSTNISLVLNANADLSVKVYNLTGQLVDVIAEGNFSPSTYNWTWKAENLASGVYFIKTQVGSNASTQKVMLLK